MSPDDSPVQVSLVKDWLQVSADELGVREEAVRVLRRKVAGLANLLVLEGVAPAEIEALLPPVVTDSMRKVLGLGATGGFLGRRRTRTPPLPRATLPPTSVADIADRLVGPSQRRVWQHLLATSRTDGPPRVFSPAELADELDDLGEPANRESVRKVLKRLTDLGGTHSARPGRYQLTPDARAYAQMLADDVPGPSAATTARDGHPSSPPTRA
ncbi:hypothetical protein SAMN04488107_0047 [Geodermatophilus saharensis]|uniref:Uncharacterized protein n=1 Tax=Geodermatophilus saharensis TaxID=1137994 RepID=A0A238ZF54_9ACTN|nr:hypothetical protein [Geodermatophilus saharensis]SNR82135.1 hypothetical protein SAMN04488107_0047 [Geodermatophilus saharensis]